MIASPTRSRLIWIAPALLVATTAVHRIEAQQVPPAPENVIASGCVGQVQDTAAAPATGHEQGAA
jgi:hypothetical protein